MSELVFYTNPMSRGRIVRWMLEEIGAPYETRLLAYDTDMKAEAYRAMNPMGKVPAIMHRNKVVTEGAAICAYLADVFPEAGLGPRDEEKADYYRWLFFASGPLEQAITNKAMDFDHPPERNRMFGYGDFETATGAIDQMLQHQDYVCGERFTAADVYVGSQIIAPMEFGILPERASFVNYRDRLSKRDAYRRGQDIDNAIIAEMKAKEGARA